MDKKDVITIKDIDGTNKEIELLTALEVDNQKYIVYTIDKDENNCDVMVARITDDNQISSITDPDEREKIFKIVEKMFDIGK